MTRPPGAVRPRSIHRRRPGLRLALALAAAGAWLGVAVPVFGEPTYEDHPPRLLVQAPSEAVVGEPVRWSVLLSTRWGPEGPEVPTAGVDRAIRLEVSATDPTAEIEDRLRIPEGSGGHGTALAVFRTPGLHRIRVDGEAGLAGESHPILVRETPPAERVWWGDLHAHLHGPGRGHAGALPAGEHARLLAEGLAFGRDVALVDFCAFTPHVQTAGGLARPMEGTEDTPWDRLLAVVEAANQPGEFVVFPGFEWQGDAGDHCVIYPGPGPLDAPADIRRLAESVAARGGLLTAHAVFLPTSFEPLVPLSAIEVTRDTRSTEALGLAALRRGVVTPFLGCSDTHGGAIGATSLTGLRAERLTRGSVLAAIRAGNCWATNGERIVLDFRADVSGALPRLLLSGVGTGPIDRVELWRNGKLLAEARGEEEQLRFEHAWEDPDLLRLDCLDREVAYHARVVQTTANRWDPSRRDVAISSPVSVRIAARHFDTAHARRAGRSSAAAGAAGVGDELVAIRAALNAFRAEPERALRASGPEGAPIPRWPSPVVDKLRSAIAALSRRATRDSTLLPLASTLAAVPDMAVALGEIRTLRERSGEASSRGPRLEALRARAREVHRRAAAAMVVGATGRLGELKENWFGARLLERLAAEPLREVAARADQADRKAATIPGSGGEPVERLEVPIDPRTLVRLGAVTARARRLRAELEERWGFTGGSYLGEDDDPVARIRVVGEGSPEGARLSGGDAELGWELALEPSRTGWIARLTRAELPAPGDPPMTLSFSRPTVISKIFLETPDGDPIRDPGRVEAPRVTRSAKAATAVLQADADSVEATLLAGGDVLWSGQLGRAPTPLAFPGDALGEPGDLELRWGFSGWHRVSGTTLPGHAAARPLGLGALPDGRALVALADGLVLVDPGTGRHERLPWPAGCAHEAGREFCVAALGDGRVLVRGATGPSGGWARALDPASGAWSPVAPGPEAGTVASHPDGGYAWLTGNTLRRRDEHGDDLPSLAVDAPGRLLGFDPAGRPVVRVASGAAVWLDPRTGAAVGRAEGPALAVDDEGGVLRLAGLGGRHRELACEIRLTRVLLDGSTRGPFSLAVRTLPAGEEPILVAAAPGDELLVVGGTTWWRRLPDHDWWGATVDHWKAVHAGSAAEN